MTTATRISLDDLVLKPGAHNSPRQGLCVMEAVAYFRGIEHTDRPPCVSPAIGEFLRAWNDNLNDDDRQKLKPYILKVAGTATTEEDEQRRAWLATDWLVRIFTPAWLKLAGLEEHANALRNLPELTTDELAALAQPIIESALKAASAAGSAAGSAAWSAAWSAAGSAAGSAAWSAARSAAGSAADAALRDTVVELQASAFNLLDRMIAVGVTAVAA